MKKKNLPLYDYLYVDTGKILSVYSQLTGETVTAGDALYETVRQAVSYTHLTLPTKRIV